MRVLSKIGVIGAAAALTVFAGAVPAMADSSTGTQGVTGTLSATMAVTVPTAASLTLVPGATATADGGTVVVNSNAPYVLQVSDANNGELTDAGNSNRTLASPLSVKSATTATGATATSVATSLVGSSTSPVQLGTNSGPADPSGDSYDVTLSQPVSWADAVSTDGYTDTLTYTVAAPVA